MSFDDDNSVTDVHGDRFYKSLLLYIDTPYDISYTAYILFKSVIYDI